MRAAIYYQFTLNLLRPVKVYGVLNTIETNFWTLQSYDRPFYKWILFFYIVLFHFQKYIVTFRV